MAGMTARLDVLCAGYAADRVASTVALIRDQGAVIVVDPGMVAGRRRILDPLARLGVDPAAVTDVVLSHHHPDHTLNAALFERARMHDFWAIYAGDIWTDRPADGFALSPSVRLMATPATPPRTSPRSRTPTTASPPARTCGGRSRARRSILSPRIRICSNGPGPGCWPSRRR
jgi:glyoxylase-like metal-dependent hydrolase (beta-lactamase superfamily II)